MSDGFLGTFNKAIIPLALKKMDLDMERQKTDAAMQKFNLEIDALKREEAVKTNMGNWLKQRMSPTTAQEFQANPIDILESPETGRQSLTPEEMLQRGLGEMRTVSKPALPIQPEEFALKVAELGGDPLKVGSLLTSQNNASDRLLQALAIANMRDTLGREKLDWQKQNADESNDIKRLLAASLIDNRNAKLNEQKMSDIKTLEDLTFNTFGKRNPNEFGEQINPEALAILNAARKKADMPPLIEKIQDSPGYFWGLVGKKKQHAYDSVSGKAATKETSGAPLWQQWMKKGK